jgi:hypothetical protein
MLAAPTHLPANAMRGRSSFEARAAAASCKVPGLHPAATPPLNPPHVMSEWLPNVNGWTVGAAHFNQLEVPDQVNAVIEGFLRHYILRMVVKAAGRGSLFRDAGLPQTREINGFDQVLRRAPRHH